MTEVRLMRAQPVSRVLCFGSRSKKSCSVITLPKSFLKNISKIRIRHRLGFILCWYIKLRLQILATGQSVQTELVSTSEGFEILNGWKGSLWLLGKNKNVVFTRMKKKYGENYHSISFHQVRSFAVAHRCSCSASDQWVDLLHFPGMILLKTQQATDSNRHPRWE